MGIISEKKLYMDEFKNLPPRYDVDVYLWGEELIDKHLILYSGKLKEFIGFKSFADRLVNCGVIMLNLQKGSDMRITVARLDEETGNIYMAHDMFNSIWKYLRRSVQLGIRLKKQEGEGCDIESPEDIVCIDNLVRSTSFPVFENEKVIFKVKEKTAEQRKYAAARQSALDNSKNIYYYSKSGGYVHDKSCALIKQIPDETFAGSEDLPEGMEYCPKCCRFIFLRVGCRPNTREIPICNRIFTGQNVHTGQLKKFVVQKGIRFHAADFNEMTITCGEDTWIIKGISQGRIELWHNNYVKTASGERYITSGFHNQGLDGMTMLQMLNYVSGYSWEKHLAQEKLKKDVLIETQNIVEPNDNMEDLNEAKRNKAKKALTIKDRIFAWFKRIF